MTGPSLFLAVAVGFVISVAPSAAQPADPQDIPPGFTERLERYVDLHHAVGQLVGDSIEHDREFAVTMRQVRHFARRGDIFTPDVAASFRARLAAALRASGYDAAQLVQQLTAIGEDDEGVYDGLEINEVFPAGFVTSIPGRLLWSLPALPRELEYRFFGNSLVLVDVRGNLVVDILEGALPTKEAPTSPSISRGLCAVHPDLPACWI